MKNQTPTIPAKTSARHTPGPWSRVDTRIYHDFKIDGHNSSRFIATTLSDNDYTPNAEQIANARLIAAAPTLLTMLQRLMSEVMTNEQCFSRIAPLTLEQARAAIQSATL